MNVLVLTTDLPFFPGKNGHDFFNLRYLAQQHTVGVVAPLYSHYPADGVANLENAVGAAYLWPRPAAAAALPPQKDPPGPLRRWLEALPKDAKKGLLLRLLGLHRQPSDAYGQLAIFANGAPQLLEALAERPWQLVILIQSSTEPWLDYLPSQPAKLVYFHDVRADFLQQQAQVSQGGSASPQTRRTVLDQERRACNRVELAGFVSALDEQRALKLFHPSSQTGVAPIPVDAAYYTPPPAGWRKDGRPIVLFTGHLSHPPNVDAVRYFIEQIWPLVLDGRPEAVFHVAGCLPDAALKDLCAGSRQVELHGDVPDIRPYFWNASVYVVPMRFGGGVRQKIFEAWLMEVPVVCSTMAAEGTKAVSGENCWLEDAPARVASRIMDVLRAPEATITSRARQTARAHNSIPAAASKFEQLARRAVQIKRQRPYKLLFDLRWMQIGKAGGAEQMSYELIAAIARLDARNEYRVFCPRSTFYEWDFPEAFRCRGFFTDSLEARFEALGSGLANLLAKSAGKPPLLSPEMRALRWYNRADFDLVHSLCGYTFPDVQHFPNILTVLDLQHVHFPGFFTPHAWAEREALYRQSANRAAHIICISEHTRMDLHKSYGIPLEKMTTIWIIPSRAAWIGVEEGVRRRLLAGMGLNKPFLFYPAHSWPHKNHQRLIEAFKLAGPGLPADIQLVLTGRKFEQDHPAREAIRAGGLEGRVVHLGYRSPLELRALYGSARALVFPSLFEGFGMPVAEAMIADCPVACSKTTSLPEIGGDAAVYFDPQDTQDMARALVEIATDEARRAGLLAAARRRRTLFSSRRSAVKTLSVYRRVFEDVYGESKG